MLRHVGEQFVIRLHQAFGQQNAAEISTLYERTFNSLSTEFYTSTEWPRAEVVSSLVRNGSWLHL